MITSSKKTLKWMIALLALVLVVGCSSANPTKQADLESGIAPSTQPVLPSQTNPAPSVTQPADTTKELLLNMKQLAEQGKVINCDFPVKTTIIEDIKSKWGEPDKTEWLAVASGNYATYTKQAIVVGFNKGSQIMEVRSFDKQLQKLSLAKTKEVYGTPAHDVKVNGEQIIGYTAGQEYKIEFIFPLPSSSNPDPMMDHYLVLYPRGTVNNMADDPGRQW